MRPVMNAISWMDERSTENARFWRRRFPSGASREVTGQMGVLPTWPASKILWLRRHRPELFAAVHKYALIKDYVAYRLTGRLCADCSVATFTLYSRYF